MHDQADDELLEKARSGDREALEALLERHQAQVYRFGMKMCRNPEDAKDVLQDTLLAMARGVRDFRGASSLATWLFTIARSQCIKKRRKSKLAPAAEQSLDAARDVRDPAKSADDALAGKQAESALEQAIARLEPASREVLVLRDIEGLSAKEVAEVLGITVQAVKSRLHRARLAVREGVAPLFGTPEAAPAAGEKCPDVLDLFSHYLEGDISADVCAEMERHLGACGRCRAACDSLKHTLALCRTRGPAVEVPPAVKSSVKVALRNLLADRA